MDREYADDKRLYKVYGCNVFSIPRAKDHMNYCRFYSHPKDTANCVMHDQSIVLNNYAGKYRLEKMRRINSIMLKAERGLCF